MMFSKKLIFFLVVAVLLGLVAACGGPAQTNTVVQTVVVEKEVQGETVKVVETVVVEKEVEKVVTVQVEKPVAEEKTNPDAGKITLDSVIGTEPPTIDPALATDTTSVFF